MNRFLRALAVTALACLWSLTGHATTLGDLDKILTQAPNLTAFLQDPKLIDEYYTAAEDYYGPSNFPRQSYDMIIEQIREVAPKIPHFAERSWETSLGQAFSVTSSAPTYGRDLGDWDGYFSHWKENLRATSTSLASAELPPLLEKIKHKIATKEAEIDASDLRKKEKEIQKGKFFQSLREDPDVQRASSSILLGYLESPQSKEVFESQNPDLILNSLKNLKDNPKLIPGADVVASAVKAKIPELSSVLNEKYFPIHYLTGKDGKAIAAEAGAAGKWDFIPGPRRFHAFFKGIMFGECVGGSCKPQFAGSLTPERWATILLKDTEFHYVEKDGKFLGWVQAVPLQRNGKIYASVDFASPNFRQAIIEKTPDGRLHTNSMLGGWLREAMKHKPESWDGFIVGQSNAINNGGALPAVRSSPSYILGEKYDSKTHPFAHTDPSMVQALTNVLPRGGYAQNYGGNMIFDGAVKDAGVLTVLKPTDQTIFSLVKDALQRGDRKYIDNLLNQIHSGAMSDYHSEIMTFRDAGVLKLLADNGFGLPKNVVYYSVNPADYTKRLLESGLSLREYKLAQRLMSRSVVETMAMNQALLQSDRIKDVPTLIEALQYELPTPSDPYKAAMEDLRGSTFDRLIQMNPSYEEYLDFWKKCQSKAQASNWGRLIGAMLASTKTAEQFATVLKMTDLSSRGDAYKKEIGAALRTEYPHLLTLSPSPEDFLAYSTALASYAQSDSPEYREATIAFLRSGLAEPESAKTAQEFIDLMKLKPDHQSNATWSNQMAKHRASKLDAFLALHPSYQEILEYRNLGVFGIPSLWQKLWVAELQSAPSADAYLESLAFLKKFRTDHTDWAVAIFKAKKESYEHFVSLSPNVEQLMRFRSALRESGDAHTPFWNQVETAILERIGKDLDSAPNAKSYLEILRQDVSRLDDELKKSKLSDHSAKYFESFLRHHPSYSELDEFRNSNIWGYPKLWTEVAKHQLEQAENITEYNRVLDRIAARNTTDAHWTPGYRSAMEESYEHLLQLSPEAKDLIRYRDLLKRNGGSVQHLNRCQLDFARLGEAPAVP